MTSLSRVLKSQSVLDPLSRPKILVETAAPTLAGEVQSATSELVVGAAAEAERLLQQATTECNVRISAAEQQAKAMLDEAARQIEARAEEAREAGYREGYEAGRQEAMTACAKEYQQWIEQAEGVLREAQLARLRLLGDIHHTLTRIAVHAVQTILRRELLLQAADIDAIVSDLLQYVVDGTKIEVRVHPHDFAAATAAHPRWTSTKFGEWEIIIVPDTSVSEGGCEIRSEVGRVDSRLETKLTLMQEAIREVMERGIQDYVDSHC